VEQVEEEAVSRACVIGLGATLLALACGCDPHAETEAPFLGPVAQPPSTCSAAGRSQPEPATNGSVSRDSLFSVRLPVRGDHLARLRDGRQITYSIVTAHIEPCFADFALAHEREIFDLLDVIWRTPGLPSPVTGRDEIAYAMRVALDNLFRSRTAVDPGLVSARIEVKLGPA
jgi:hypothetical protein